MDENINKINIKTKRGPDSWFWKGRLVLGWWESTRVPRHRWPMVSANIAFPLRRSADRDKMSNGVCGVAESLRGFAGLVVFFGVDWTIYLLSPCSVSVSESVPRIWNWKGGERWRDGARSTCTVVHHTVDMRNAKNSWFLTFIAPRSLCATFFKFEGKRSLMRRISP